MFPGRHGLFGCDKTGLLQKRLLLASLLIQTSVCFQDLHRTSGHGVLGGWVLDIWPKLQVVVGLDLIEVWADVQALSLASCNGLWQREQCCAQSAYPLCLERRARCQCRSYRRNLDAIPILNGRKVSTCVGHIWTLLQVNTDPVKSPLWQTLWRTLGQSPALPGDRMPRWGRLEAARGL
jgi:hypothetical protein